MPVQPQWSAEPEKQAEYLNEFKKQTAAELAAIKARLIWLLMPAFLILLAVLGLSLYSLWNLSELKLQVDGTQQAVGDLKRSLKKAAEADQQTAKPVFVENGLTPAERAEFYHLAEGSEVFPLEWMQALENKNTGNLFMDDLYDMGFLRDWDTNNKNGLPVGLTSAPARGLEPLGDMVGLNCAACHVGEMSYKGTRIRIDGAPNFLDTRTFFASLVESAFATLEDSDKLLAFVARIKKNRADNQSADTKVRLGAKLINLLKDKAEHKLIEVIAPEIKRIVEAEKNENDEKKLLDLAKSPTDAGKDAASIRKKLLDKFDQGRIKALLNNPVVKNRLEELAKDADHPGTLLHTFEEIYIGVRLLKARAVFLKKLGMVGTDEKTVWGPGRVDAFGSARAFLFEDGYKPVNPVSYPYIWGLYRIDWFHYDNNTTSILQRNFGQALGVGAVYDPDTKSSSLHPRNLYELESLATKLKPPTWPGDIFGKIDPDSAARGKKHYDSLCAKCHEPKQGEKLLNFLEGLDAIKTDPLRAKMFALDLPVTKDRPKAIPFPKAIGDAMEAIMQKSFEDNNVTPEEREKFKRAPWPGAEIVKVEWRGPSKYSTRPLSGVWASGPFLHNGSVPTIDDLLKPADKRPVEFYVGNREFDPEKLGYISTPPAGKKNNFDTRIEGNHNTGHEYGAKLSDGDRKDLLEYLKALP